MRSPASAMIVLQDFENLAHAGFLVNEVRQVIAI
jgi:hypothetical protein